MKKKPRVKDLSNKELVDEYRFLVSWSGDDFCLTDMEDEDYDRMYACEDEILSRMK